MIEIITLLVALILGLIILWLTNELKKTRQKIDENTEALSLKQNELEQIQFKLVEANTEVRALRERLEAERQDSIQKQKESKEQVELIAQSIIQKGTKMLQSENQQNILTILEPFKNQLSKFEKEVQDTKLKDIEQYASMKEMVTSLSKQHAEMHSTAQNLVDALRGEQKVQGDWGEMALERILETSGLENGREYKTQDSFRDDQGNHMRPDVVVYLPEEKHIVIDSKVSLKAFERYINAENDADRKIALANHLLSIKTHIKQLGEKNYAHLEGISSPDFVLLFIPLESSFALAIREEPDLYQMAWDKKIVLVTPSTLLATLKTVSSIWKQEKQTKNAIEIATQAGRLYDKFLGFVSDMENIGKKQKDANDAYHLAMNKLKDGNGNLIRSAEKLKELGAKTKKDLDKKYLQDLDDENS